MNIQTKNIYIKIQEGCFFVENICLIQLKFSLIYIGNTFSKYRFLIGEYIVKISREVSLNMSMRSNRLDFWRFDIKSLS